MIKDTPEMTELLDEMEKAVVVCVQGNATRSNRGWADDPRWNTARLAIESAFSKLETENKRLRMKTSDDDPEHQECKALYAEVSRLSLENQRLRTVYSVCPNCNTSWTNGEVEGVHKNLDDDNQRLREENQRLHRAALANKRLRDQVKDWRDAYREIEGAQNLTPEETKAALFFVNGHEGNWPDEAVESSMRAKLLRSLGTPK